MYASKLSIRFALLWNVSLETFWNTAPADQQPIAGMEKSSHALGTDLKSSRQRKLAFILKD